MTTFWARLKIWEAYKSYNITDKCGQYFDELLNKYRFKEVNHIQRGVWISTNEEIVEFNGENGVLYNIGHDINRGFDVPTYIARSTFGNKTLSSIIGEEYVNLEEEILKYINSENATSLNIAAIHEYLKASHYACCRQTNNAKELVVKLLTRKEELKKLENQTEITK